ncbi:MAG: hypothetical protein HY875_14840 [Chloroflexi bacterium]|nr:hypothetical protein [Chloroflexota bacterium]
MNAEEQFAEVESPAFAALATAVSGPAAFVRQLSRLGPYQRLLAFLTAKDERSLLGHQHALALRVESIARAEPEPGHEHELDACLAAYIVALHQVDSIWLAAARSWASAARGAWWTRRVLDHIQRSEAGSAELSITTGSTMNRAPRVTTLSIARSAYVQRATVEPQVSITPRSTTESSSSLTSGVSYAGLPVARRTDPSETETVTPRVLSEVA